MTTRAIRLNLYKVLRRTGVPRNLIAEDAEIREELLLDEIDMTCFLYYLETKFDVDVKNEEMSQLNSVKSTINYLQLHCA